MKKSILKATIEKETFGNLLTEPKDNLQEAFMLLGEELTRQKAIEIEAHGLDENLEAATEGGRFTRELIDHLEAKGTRVI